MWTWLLPRATRQKRAFTVELLASRRMREVRQLWVEQCHRESQQLVNAINRHSKLSRVTFNNCNLTQAQSRALAVTLTALNTFEIKHSVLGDYQLFVLFRRMTENTTLRSMCVCETDLSSISPGLLARALENLRDVAMPGTGLTRNQVEAVFRTVSQDTSNMISLDIGSVQSVSLVNAHWLATTVSQLQMVNLNNIQLTSRQAQAICFAICDGSRLKIFTCNSLHLVASSLLARAANRLEVLHTDLFREQTEALLTLSLDRTSLKQLNVKIIQGFVNKKLIEKANKNIGSVHLSSLRQPSRSLNA